MRPEHVLEGAVENEPDGGACSQRQVLEQILVGEHEQHIFGKALAHDCRQDGLGEESAETDQQSQEDPNSYKWHLLRNKLEKGKEQGGR